MRIKTSVVRWVGDSSSSAHLGQRRLLTQTNFETGIEDASRPNSYFPSRTGLGPLDLATAFAVGLVWALGTLRDYRAGYFL